MVWSRTNQLLLAAARQLGGHGEPISAQPTDYFMRLCHGDRAVIVSKTRSPFLTQVAQTLVNNKHVSRELLRQVGIPVIDDVLLDETSTPDEPEVKAFVAANPRLVVKPNWGNRGWGVSLDVREGPTLERAVARARALDRDEEVLLEPFVPGGSVRVTVIGGRFEACAEVTRPVVVGDGRRSVRALIAALNEDPRRGSWVRPGLESLDQIEHDEELDAALEVADLGLDDVLPAGRTLTLVTDELEVEDRTDQLHHAWADLAERACRRLGADVAGVDFIGPWGAFEGPPSDENPARLLEINVLPALHLHALPTKGEPRPVFEAFVRYCLQLPGAPAPITAIEA